MTDITRRPANRVILIKLETVEGVDANPDPTTDAVPFEIGSANRNSPFTTEQSNEATGSYVAGSPLIIGQPATFSFRSRIKGAGAGVTYSASVKPPLHAALASCGWRPQFTDAIAAALASAGSTTSATLAAGFPATARALVGLPLMIAAGTGAGRVPLVVNYTSGRVATLGELFGTALDATSSIGLPANWSYAGTSPVDAAARAIDHPSATIYDYNDGVLTKYFGVRGVLGLDGNSARPGYGAFNFSGIFGGRADAAVPATAVVANHKAPVLVRGTSGSPVALLNRKELSLSAWSLDAGSQATSPDDPNTSYGYGAGQLAGRVPVLTVDPLATILANRDSIADIEAGTEMAAVLRHGSTLGNSWSLTLPRVVKTGESDSARGDLAGEQITMQALSPGRDAVTRDLDRVITFF